MFFFYSMTPELGKHIITMGIIFIIVGVGLTGCLQSPIEGTWAGGLLEIKIFQNIGFTITRLQFTEKNAYLSMRLGTKKTYIYRGEMFLNGTYSSEGHQLQITTMNSSLVLTFEYRFETENGRDVLYLNNEKFTRVIE
jgi:hypothetical protein